MKYMLMMHMTRGKGDWEIFNWPQEAFQAHMEYWDRLNRDITAAGEWVEVQGLAAPGEAKLVRAAAKGPLVTDGPFAETKEFLAGYWIVDVESVERAYEIAAKASVAPGPDGAPLNMPIEVRRVMSGPAEEG